MAVRIRMKRLGRKHRPFFRICVMDSRSPRDGKAIEELGFYDPMVRVKKDRVKLNLERVEYWIGVGAQPSVNVAALIKKIRTNRFGDAAAPPPMTAPKARPAKVAAGSDDAPPEATTES